MVMQTVDLKDLIGRDTQLKKVASTRGGEFAGACPFCGGIDRFHVQPNYGNGHFFCRQCDVKGDAIEYIKRRDNVSFKEALVILGIPLEQQRRSTNVVQRPAYDPTAPRALETKPALDDPDWQESARLFCEQAFNALWSAEGSKALEWLKNRGISESVIESAGLGFNPEDTNTTWGLNEVFIDRGIVIPWSIGGKFWRVNVRRPTGEPKYRGVKGGANGLYNADAIGRDDVVLMTEGEFDALVIKSHVKGVTPIATGAVSWSRVLRWVSLLDNTQLVLNAFDGDEVTNDAVAKSVEWWRLNLGSKFVRLIPTEHDVTDMWKAGKDLQAWVEPYSLWYTRDNTEVEIKARAKNRAEMAAMGYRLVEVI
jgi:DNA primase